MKIRVPLLERRGVFSLMLVAGADAAQTTVWCLEAVVLSQPMKIFLEQAPLLFLLLCPTLRVTNE